MLLFNVGWCSDREKPGVLAFLRKMNKS